MNTTQERIYLQDLKTSLDQEILVYEGIQQILSEKRQVIIQGDLNRLIQLDTELESYAQKAQDLEKDRLGILHKMGRDQDTLKVFINTLSQPEDTQTFTQIRDKLFRTTEDVKELSKANRDLLTQSIRFIEQSVETIATLLSPEGASYNNRSVKKSSFMTPPHPGIAQLPSSTISREA